MDRAVLLEEIRTMMARAGFAVSERCDLRPVSFDLVARRDDTLVIIKVLANVEALSQPIADEIKLLCKMLKARPVLLGLRAGTGPLEPGVVYARHGIPIVTPHTLQEYMLDGAPPLVFAAPGGFYVHLDVDALQQARQRYGLSLGALAKVAGVSRRAIQMYEEGMSASIDVAMRLEQHLDVPLVEPIHPLDGFDSDKFDPKPANAHELNPLESRVYHLLESLGYNVRATRRSPFNALSTQEKQIYLTGMGEDSPQLRRRARFVRAVSHIAERPGFFVLEHSTRTEIEGVPVLTRVELRRISDPEGIMDLILERQRRQQEP